MVQLASFGSSVDQNSTDCPAAEFSPPKTRIPFGFVGLGVDVAVVFAVAVTVVDAAVEVSIVAVVAVVCSVVVAAHWSKEGASLGPPTASHSACRVRYSRHSSEVEL